jgi:hypothetical protein
VPAEELDETMTMVVGASSRLAPRIRREKSRYDGQVIGEMDVGYALGLLGGFFLGTLVLGTIACVLERHEIRTDPRRDQS